MAFDIDETKGRIATLKAKEARRQKREAATAKGFKRLEDYEAWLALEQLAQETRAARAAQMTVRISGDSKVTGNLQDYSALVSASMRGSRGAPGITLQ